MVVLVESGIKVRKSNSKINKNYYGYIFTAPFIIVFLLFSFYPLIYTFYLSLTDMTIMSKTYNFVGLNNFKQLFSDDFFIKSVLNTWKIWLMNFLPQLGIAMLLAVWFMNNRLKIKFVGLWRTVYYLPNLLMPVAIAALFYNLFSRYGPVNQIAVRAGILEEAFDFFRSPGWTQSIVAFIQWWMWFGVTILYLMAGMSSISPSYYEAALVDGASSWDMFTKITLPLLKPVLIYVLVTSLAGGMQMFDIPYLLTDGRGSPNGSIMTMSVLMYMKFSSGKGFIGAGASVAVMIFIITAISASIIIRLLREKE
ncbi:carbohydrate ABC transporter permease [Thermoanaerobacter thermocopriae]|nr:sugar ABC transporter permease [Thermoanaerobacter thermocopriae]